MVENKGNSWTKIVENSFREEVSWRDVKFTIAINIKVAFIQMILFIL